MADRGPWDRASSAVWSAPARSPDALRVRARATSAWRVASASPPGTQEAYRSLVGLDVAGELREHGAHLLERLFVQVVASNRVGLGEMPRDEFAIRLRFRNRELR